MRHKLKSLKDQVIVITGATSGIGLTTACMAASRGAAVVLAARNEEALETICSAMRARGGRCETVVADVGKREDVQRIAETAQRAFGGFDTWVNNAGIGAYATLEQMSDEDHERLFQTNYWGVVYGSTEALKTLKKRGGVLINVGSISSEMPSPLLSAYTASKFAVKGFTDSLRLELIHEGAPVRVTLIQPSGIDTPFGEHAKNYMDEASQVPPPVYAPEVVAKAILHAAQYPTRDLIVGGWGRFMVQLARSVPVLADQVFSFAFFRTAKQHGRSPRDTPKNMHSAGEDGKRYGDQGHHFSHSLYTTAKMYPVTSLGIIAVGVLGVLALTHRSDRHHHRGYYDRLRGAGHRLSDYAHDHGYGRGRHSYRSWLDRGYGQLRDASNRVAHYAHDHGYGRGRHSYRSWLERYVDQAREASHRLRHNLGW